MAPAISPTPRDLTSALILCVIVSAGLFVAVLYAQFDFALDVTIYHEAIRLAASGSDVYGERFATNQLPFAYPPTALLVLAWASGPLPFVVPALWIASCCGLILAIRALITPERCLARLSPTDTRAVFLTVLVLICLPVAQTLNLGQVNILLLALVVIDAIGLRNSRYSGILIGLATCIKLTPGLFIIWLWLSGRRRAALNAVLTIGVVIAITGVVFPASAAGYIEEGARLAIANNAPLDTKFNQSASAVIVRAGLEGLSINLAVNAVNVAVIVACLIVSRRLMAAGRLPLAVTTVGIVSASVAPIAWIHHFVWLPLLAVALWTERPIAKGSPAVAALLYLLALIPPSAAIEFRRWDITLPMTSTYFLVTVGIVTWLLISTRRLDNHANAAAT